ncbi:MAG TPA: LemA family protein [Desulfitobacteriaceae bacterium]|nr:LemA family protein [Desulfitobacteriaceae bacterium]
MAGGWIAIGVLAVLLAVFLVSIYNSLVQLRQRVKNAWSQVDVQLKRRYDLIPNLVNTVKGYAQHEKSTLESVTQARNMAMAAGNVKDQAEAENMLSGALRSLFAVAEAYPELKANANFLQLQGELSDTESKIAFARQFYNDTVQKFNTKIAVFPNNLVAGLLGFQMADYFTLQGEPETRQAVKVEF